MRVKNPPLSVISGEEWVVQRSTEHPLDGDFVEQLPPDRKLGGQLRLRFLACRYNRGDDRTNRHGFIFFPTDGI